MWSRLRSRRLRSRRLLTAAGSVTALLGLGIAVGTGAVHLPLSATAASRSTTDAISAPRATASQSSVSAYGYHLATMSPSPAAPRHQAPSRKATAKPKPRPTATMSSAPATTPVTTPATTPVTTPSSGRFTSGPVPTHSPTPVWSPTPSSPKPVSSSPVSSPPASSPPASGSGLTPQATAENQTPTGQNQLAWSEAILKALGDPLTSANIISMGYWMQNEAGSPPSGIVGENNPINVSLPGYGGTPIQYEAPGYSLMSYPTVQDGVQATAAYLNNGSYPQILSDLKQGVGLSDPSLGSELQEYSGSGYSTIPDSWGQSQGQPLS
jgi:hypothetical protein